MASAGDRDQVAVLETILTGRAWASDDGHEKLPHVR